MSNQDNSNNVTQIQAPDAPVVELEDLEQQDASPKEELEILVQEYASKLYEANSKIYALEYDLEQTRLQYQDERKHSANLGGVISVKNDKIRRLKEQLRRNDKTLFRLAALALATIVALFTISGINR